MGEYVPFDNAIKQRRSKLGSFDSPDQEASGTWGLALSGGGIRSATFCLGLLTALAKRQMLLRFDLLSTVSGGGYIGATLGRLLSRAKSSVEVKAVADAFADASARWFTWWLRANGRYLIPRGAKDTTFAVALYLRNIAATHFELGMLTLLLGVALAAVDIAGWGLISYLGYELNDTFFAVIRYLPDWLPTLALLLPPVAAAGTIVASAYWCIPWLASTESEPRRPLLYWLGAVAFVVLLWLLRNPLTSIPTDIGQSLRALLWWAAMLLVIAWLLSLPIAAYVLSRSKESDGHVKADRVRHRLTGWLANIIRVGAAVVLLGALDRFAWYLAFELTPALQAGAGLALASAVAVARAVLPLISGLLQQRRGLETLLLIGRVAGYSLTFLLCAWWVSIIHRAALGAAFQRLSPNFADSLTVLLIICIPAVAYLLLTGRSMAFLNLSSLHAFYRARLVRSYLGAANSRRFEGQATEKLPYPTPVAPTLVSVGSLQEGDDISFANYKPQEHGGPIHIINVCVNQTRDPRGGLFNQDRRGLLLSVASTGQMRLSQDVWTPLPAGNGLTLGTWTAVSGAALAPGLGSLSRGGISALATFAGLRLGYWWRGAGLQSNAQNTSKPPRPSLLAKSIGLVRETFGVFRGNERPDWFLTDGGHFENTGAYALLAERASVIVLADCGADPDYSFGDLENLVRKARIDLQAEVLFQRPRKNHSKDEADAKDNRPESSPWPREVEAFGSLSELASSTSTSCLALARITYGGQHPGKGILIVVKPNVSDGLPIDLVNFKLQNPQFPQETTADQFFSEAQWESYFQLGQFLGGKLTKEFVEGLRENWSVYFEPDEQSPFDTAVAAVQKPEKEPSASSRLPARISATTVSATLGLGAAATIGVSVWQAIDSVRTSADKEVTDERAALKELADLWAKLPPAEAAASSPDAVSALASAIVRTADTLCPKQEASWFQKSALAAQVYSDARRQCGRHKAQPACATLLEAAHPALQSKLPNCLIRDEQATIAVPPPRYWVFDYSTNARFARAHPCDPLAGERQWANQLYLANALQLDVANVSTTSNAPTKWRPANECTVAPSYARLQAAFTGLRERVVDDAIIAAADSIQPPLDSALPSASKPAGPFGSSPQYRSGPQSAGAASTRSPWADASPSPDRAARARLVGRDSKACEGKTIYIQIYGPAQRNEVRDFREPWRALGASVPPIEDVTASARVDGRALQAPVRMPTVRIQDSGSRPCAEALAPAAGQSGWTVEMLSPRLKAAPNVLEVWIPPKSSN